MQFRKTWFSLVEFIITLIVLSIISIIVVILFWAYMSWIRDEQRISDLNSLSLDIKKIYKKWRIPVGSTFTSLTYDKTIIWYQWIISKPYLKKLKINTDFIDPLEERNYYITISSNRKYFQLLAFLENESLSQNQSSEYFDDFSWYSYTNWDDLWFVINDNFKINELDFNLINNSNSSFIFSNRIDRSTDILSQSLGIVYNNGGVNCYRYFWEYRCDKQSKKGWQGIDENCKKEDIIIWDQVWAWCNSTIWKGLEYINWDCYDYDGKEELNIDCNKESSENDSEYYKYNTTHNIWWKLYPYNARRTACRQWRRVPNNSDFAKLEKHLNKWTCREWTSIWQCSQLWWHRNISYPEIKKTIFYNLQLPLSGVYVPSLEIFQKRWKSAYIWWDNWNAYSISTEESWIMKYWLNKNNAMSIRCIK